MICPQLSHLVQSPSGTFPRFCSTGCRGCFSLRNQLMDVEASLQRGPGGVKGEGGARGAPEYRGLRASTLFLMLSPRMSAPLESSTRQLGVVQGRPLPADATGTLSTLAGFVREYPGRAASRALDSGFAGAPSATVSSRLALVLCTLALCGRTLAADSFGSYRFAVGERAVQIPSMVVSGEQGGREAEFISLKGAAGALGGTLTALDTKGSFRLELAR